MKLTFVLGSILLATTASAAVITNFTATPSLGTPFSTVTFTTSFSNNVAVLTNATISCTADAGCSGPAIDFSVGATGVTAGAPLVISIDGSLSGNTPGGGILVAPGVNVPFGIPAGGFDIIILSTSLPIPGTLSTVGTLFLSLAGGQTLTLPSSFNITLGASSVPEPGTISLVGLGLAGLAIAARRRAARVA